MLFFFAVKWLLLLILLLKLRFNKPTCRIKVTYSQEINETE